jgi:hypothetical protein
MACEFLGRLTSLPIAALEDRDQLAGRASTARARRSSVFLSQRQGVEGGTHKLSEAPHTDAIELEPFDVVAGNPDPAQLRAGLHSESAPRCSTRFGTCTPQNPGAGM